MGHDDGNLTSAADACELNRWWTVTCSVSNVVHDLKNALQVISGNVEMLQARGALDPVTDRRLQAIAAQAVRAVATIDPLLGYARAASAGPTLVDLRALAVTALSFRSVTLRRAGVATRIASSSEEPLFSRIDPAAALQLLLNLLLEAEWDVSGRQRPAIALGVEQDGDVAVVVVEGRAEGPRPEAPCDRPLAAKLCAKAIAELARTHAAGVRTDQDPGGVRLTLRVPLGAARQAADSLPPSR